jgi:hypothetical protein
MRFDGGWRGRDAGEGTKGGRLRYLGSVVHGQLSFIATGILPNWCSCTDGYDVVIRCTGNRATGGTRTGVKSRSSSTSVAEVAASMRSSHRFPCTHAAVCGSADKALRSLTLERRPNSRDLLRSCFGRRPDWVREPLRGRGGRLWMGGSVEERPGGEWARMDGRSSR